MHLEIDIRPGYRLVYDMRLSLAPRVVGLTVAFVMLGASGVPQVADSPWLVGIHWYHSDLGSNDVEEMSGGRGIWVVDQALLNSEATVAAPNPWETPWVTSPVVDKTQPWAKPGYIQAVTAKGHSAIMRLQPQWGVNVPHPSDAYTIAAFAEDCKAAANLMPNVRVWQIGNEANLTGEMTRWNAGTSRYDIPWTPTELAQAPELYAQCYMATRDKIHEVTPGTVPPQQVVLMQPCSPGGVGGDRYMSSDDFLARMIAAVPDKSKIDGFGLHSYAQPGGTLFGADGFMSDLRRQIAIIDQAGLGDRPLFITEFNKHMPNATEAHIGAVFITTAYSMLNAWNTTANSLWPAAGKNHPVRGTAWFVYRGGAGWDDYSLQYWKTQSPGPPVTANPWYRFQTAANANFAAGVGSGPLFSPTSPWWDEPFGSTALDTSWPLPIWEELRPTGVSIGVSGGSARIGASAGFQLGGIYNSQIPFVDFAMETDLHIANNAPVAAGEANAEVRFRQSASGGPGYSLTFFSSAGAASAGQIALRRTSTWQTYKSAVVAGGINSGDSFRVQVVANGSNLGIKVLRLPGENVVIDWTAANAVTDGEFRTGGIGFYTYNLTEARLEHVSMGGTDSLDSSKIDDWNLYH